MLIGLDPANSKPHIWHSIREGKKQGFKLIVIDPRKTETAELVDILLQLSPGTDTALLLSMINVIIKENYMIRNL
uniref:Molybdopterin oxidoreductase domain-containing protein n=1 Tax=candidate division WOR-3 bacterium TaxID=2052148 RepID=A0A7C2K2S4_UNCW3